MVRTITNGLVSNFMGHAPDWYKLTIVHFLVLNPILLYTAGPVVTGWALVFEFIFTLAMALKCYPLQPGGLLALEAVFIGLTTPATVIHEVDAGLEVILLLIFMVAGIFFLKELLLFIFTKILLAIRSKMLLALLFSFVAALLSAFLDALTVTAVVITVAVGFYSVYHKVASGKQFHHEHDHSDDQSVQELHRADLDQFRAFLRSLVMHAAVGTALGGVCTLVGEPQNLLIAERAHWQFMEFFFRMSPISMPVLIAGLITAVTLEKAKLFGFGANIPEPVRQILVDFDASESEKRTVKQKASLIAQALVAGWLVIGLLFHLAPVGLIGLSVIVLATVATGVIEEHQIGRAFEEALPFTALLVVFFAVVAVINDQGLFVPVIDWVLALDGHLQVIAFYLANGALSSISDNVFVATVYIGEVQQALVNGLINRDQFDLLAVAINTGTNIPSVATPNGQAAFLFLLTSALAPLIRLSYMRMVIMAFPYTVVMTLTGLLAATYLLEPMTAYYYDIGLISHHTPDDIEPPIGHH
ncbi:MAG: sodium/proton antiporter NhaB [Alphaproteobacteria bacterium]|nr:MAG: sodium/proton antiporter NhaB [Alphaproteobacteria bacterium]